MVIYPQIHKNYAKCLYKIIIIIFNNTFEPLLSYYTKAVQRKPNMYVKDQKY